MSAVTVFPLKYVAETVTVRWNFLPELPVGISITSAQVSVDVFVGIDNNPSDILLGASSWDGVVVKQQLIRGLPGVIYTLICDIEASDGGVYRKASRQSVISNLGGYDYGDYGTLFLLGQLPDGILGEAYFSQLSIVGGVPPYEGLHLLSGAMPSWMSANIVVDKVVYTGLPDATGVSTFNPEVFDYVGNRASNPQEIEVTTTLSIMGDIVDGIQGGSINYQYTIANGVPPYTVSIISGTLPTGDNSDIDNTGLVIGSYFTVGLYSWVVQVQDSLGTIATCPDSCVISTVTWIVIGSSPTFTGSYMFSDGVTWMNSLRFTPTLNINIQIVTTNNSILLLAAGSGEISFDVGVTWTPCIGLGVGGGTQRGTWNTGVWMIACNAGEVKRSLDGITFNIVNTGDSLNLLGIASTGVLTLAVGYRCHRSFNLASSFIYNPAFIFSALESASCIATDQGEFLIGGHLGSLASTTDGILFTPVTSPFVGSFRIIGIAWDSGLWVITNEAGEIAYSNSTSGPWTVSGFTLGSQPSNIYALNGVFTIVGLSGRLAQSDVSMVWSLKPTTYASRDIRDVSAFFVTP